MSIPQPVRFAGKMDCCRVGWLAVGVGLLLCLLAGPAFAKQKAPVAAPTAVESATLIVSVEGLADPNADTYQRDKGLMLEDLRRDAKSQCLEKAVGAYVETHTLMENYTLIRDQVLSRSQGLIKQVLKESDPWIGEDGFAHLLMKCEVYVGSVQEALQQTSRMERRMLLKEVGDPRISVAIFVRDADRSTDTEVIRSDIAENILKERIQGFGYRVWSEEMATTLEAELLSKSTAENQVQTTVAAKRSMAADFFIKGEAKFKQISVKLPPSGVTITKYALTSWSVKCIDTRTGEELLYNNQVPKKQTWPDEDQAIEAIGQLIGAEFSKEFFERHLQAPSHMYQLEVLGLPNYETGQLLRKEFIGLRPVLNIDFRNFDKNGLSLYEVEFTGGRTNFNDLVHTSILGPLNKKIGQAAFSLESAQGQVVRLAFKSTMTAEEISQRLNGTAPSQLVEAAPERLRDLIKSEQTMQKVAEVAPEAVKKLEGAATPSASLDAVKSF
ncbi:hypothetical protein DGI_0321 [Megalodesulfovibrio gigas DSM 1382 = ATCC 19364]|uniref:Uncharacterized protein n=1 Tax=Megalodesulfovibrio gigas (strain ATCC 19364 / DSM 1382 / NCIMB 9332 / VKM B-1759) TaxID=1121448 RepID=T2G7I4_MEGG1|nr:hypothetical protein DGI_0321 [Megalodesulfovibrio gigas DSM 1382 = ATCC 19364]